MAGGRPTKYSQEIADYICEQIALGKSVRSIVAEDGMPNRSTIHLWLKEHQEFSDQYAWSCQVRQDEKFDEIRDLAANTEDVQRARLLVDVVKWQLSKEAPKKYGDKLDVVSDGDKLEGLIVIKSNAND